MRCSICGKQIKNKNLFCPHCGAPVNEHEFQNNTVVANKNKTQHKSKSLIIISVLSFALLCNAILALIFINFFTSKKIDFEELYTSYSSLDQQARDIEAKYINEDGFIIPDKKNECLDELAQLAEHEIKSGVLNNYSRGTDNILFEFHSGVPYYYSLDEEGVLSGNGLNEVMTVETSNYDWRMALAENVKLHPIDRAGETIETELSEFYTFPDSNYLDSFDLDDVSLLEGKKVIIWSGHGGYNDSCGPVLSVSTEVTNQDSLLVYSLEIANKEVILTKNNHMAISAEFFRRKLKDDSLKGSMVYLGACHSMENNALADALRAKGAELVVGYSNTTQGVWMTNTLETFIEKLTTYYPDYSNLWTAEEAMNFTRDNCGEYSIHNGIRSYFKMYPESSKFRLTDLEVPPTVPDNEKKDDDRGSGLFTAEELIDKTVPEIMELMGDDCTVEYDGDKTIWYTSGALYFYNYDKLPGFVFFINDGIKDYQNADSESHSTEAALEIVKSNLQNNKYNKFDFMAVYDYAKFNSELDAGMRYITVSGVLDNNQCQIGGAIETVIQDIENHSKKVKSASIYYNMSTDFWETVTYHAGENVDPAIMSRYNPKIKGIVVFPEDTAGADNDDNGEESRQESSDQQSSIELGTYDVEIDLGTTFYLEINSPYKLFNELKVTQNPPLLKLEGFQNGINLKTLREGNTTLTVTAPDGSVAECKVAVVVKKEPVDDFSRYAISYPYYFVDEISSPYTFLYIEEASQQEVRFRVEKGTLTLSQTADITNGNQAIFECTDNKGNTYYGFMEFDMYTIYLRLTPQGDSGTNNLAFDGRMIEAG